MATVKSPPLSAEVALIPRWHDHLLREVSRTVQLAELLLLDRIITNRTAETITSDEDVQQKQTLFEAVQDAVVHCPQPEETIRSLLVALEKAGVHTDYIRWMKEFVDGA